MNTNKIVVAEGSPGLPKGLCSFCGRPVGQPDCTGCAHLRSK